MRKAFWLSVLAASFSLGCGGDDADSDEDKDRAADAVERAFADKLGECGHDRQAESLYLYCGDNPLPSTSVLKECSGSVAELSCEDVNAWLASDDDAPTAACAQFARRCYVAWP
jgi:hypothetical protein